MRIIAGELKGKKLLTKLFLKEIFKTLNASIRLLNANTIILMILMDLNLQFFIDEYP